MMLPCLKSKEDDEKLYDEYGDKVLSVWIGMVRDGTDTSSPFKWEDTVTCDSDLNEYSNWLPNQPNDYNGNQDCVGHIYEAGTTNFAGWGDWPCNDKTKSIAAASRSRTPSRRSSWRPRHSLSIKSRRRCAMGVNAFATTHVGSPPERWRA